MIKALFFDLDGTLLDSKNKIPPKTIEALQICKRNGIHIFPTTGRPPLLEQMLHPSRDEYQIIGNSGIFYNGGCICREDFKEYAKISQVTVEKIISYITTKMKEINVAIQMSDERHSFRYDLHDDVIPLWGITKNHISPFKLFDKLAVVKIYVFTDDYKLQLDDYYYELKRLVGDNASAYLTCNGKTIDIMAKNISKKTGIEKMISYLGIDASEIAVFGDDTNDLEMLGGFKNSIAMGNAPDKVKAVANFVTRSNNDDGIYHALKNHLCLI